MENHAAIVTGKSAPHLALYTIALFVFMHKSLLAQKTFENVDSTVSQFEIVRGSGDPDYTVWFDRANFYELNTTKAFADGLGRGLQTLQYQGSNSSVQTATIFDALSRVSKVTKPFLSADTFFTLAYNAGAAQKYPPIDSANTWYSSSAQKHPAYFEGSWSDPTQYDTAPYAFSETAYYAVADSVTDFANRTSLRRYFYSQGGKNYMLVGVPLSWINSAPNGDLIIDPTTTVTGNDDVYLQDATQYGSNTSLVIGKSTGTYKKRTIIKFNVSGVPSGATVINAQMKLRYYGVGSSPWVDRSVQAHQLLVNWNETQATRDVRLTNMDWALQYGAINGTATNYGVILWATNEDTTTGMNLWFRSSEYTTEALSQIQYFLLNLYWRVFFGAKTNPECS